MDLKIEDFEWATTEILKVADICCNGRVVSKQFDYKDLLIKCASGKCS
jgi:hypothetical protein